MGGLSARAAEKDTIIIGDGGPGPYRLGAYFIDTASLKVALEDTSHYQLPSFTFIDNINALLFSSPLDSLARIRVRYRTYRYGLPKTYSLFDKSSPAPRDTLLTGLDTAGRTGESVFAQENLTLSGYKTIGVSVNNLGSANLEQTLDVSLSGEIAPHTVLSGHLSDQGSSLEGSTREVADLDMVYVSLDNPRYNVLVGDQYVQWPAGGMLSGNKKIKGISAGLTLPRVAVKGFGAISSGKFAVQTITGQSGLQGPYRLVGGGEEGFIMPISGTVRVFVGDKKFQEGIDRDFTVDYDVGSITFTPRTLIKNEDIIRVEYEYRIFDYQRTFSGAALSSSSPDSSLTVHGALWYETDDKNRPLDMALSPGDISRLAASGDSASISFGGRLIDPKDVAWQSAQQPLYRLDSLKRFRFSPFNPNTPGDNQGFYYVSFRAVGAGKGDYDLYDSAMNANPGLGQIYKYVGQGNGAAALPPVPLPQSTVTGEIAAKAAFGRLASLNVDIAGIDHDRNLFSSKNDIDNRGAAVTASGMLGAKRLDRRSLWLGGAYMHVTPAMTQEVSSAFDRNRLWDDTTGATRTGLRQSWESSAGAAIAANTFAEGSYGQYLHDGRLVTDRITGGARIEPFERLLLDYSGNYFRHYVDGGIDRTRRGDGRLAYSAALGEAALTYRDEWRTIMGAPHQGMAGAGADLSVLPLGLKESFFYSQYRRGDAGLFSARDTGFSLLWDNAVDRSFTRSWHSDLSSHYFYQNIFGRSTAATILVTAHNDVSVPSKGVSTQQTYQVTIEQASAMVQVPVPVGKGLGDHAWNDSLKEYLPAKNGDYIIQEQELYGENSDNRVRKAQLTATWSLYRAGKRLPGILADLDWSGMLSIVEQLNLGRPLGAVSWLPGALSLFHPGGMPDSVVRFADLYYRQNADWNPDSLKGYHGQLYVQPFLKKIRDYSETGLQWGGGARREVTSWVFAAEGDMVSVQRKSPLTSSEDNYRVVDRHAQVTEKRAVYRYFSAYLKEATGWARKVSDAFDNNGWYYRFMPGLLWEPALKGSAELSYTYSSVSIPGILDYRMAQGFSSGVTHTIDLSAHINFGAHLIADVSYRSQFGASISSRNGLHTVSMQMKALL